MTTRLYSSDDVGAPAHSGTTLGQVLTIIRACLVDGYGTRTAAGWTMPFSDLPNNKAVFRGQSGLGDYFRVDDNFNYEWSEVTGFATMSDVDTGAEQYPTIGGGANDTVTDWKMPNRDSNNALYDAWYVIANEEFCYVIFRATNTYRACFFFGEYEKINPTSTVPNQIVIGNATTAINISAALVEYSFFRGSETNDRTYQRRNHWNDVNRNTRLYMEYSTTPYTQPNPVDGKFYFHRVKLRDRDNTPYAIWGHMPDVIVMNDGGSEEAFNPIGDRLVVNGDNYMVAKTANGYVWGWRYDLDVG